jgi:hypothetical protein
MARSLEFSAVAPKSDLSAISMRDNWVTIDVVIHEGISVSGRIVCTEPKKEDEKVETDNKS